MPLRLRRSLAVFALVAIVVTASNLLKGASMAGSALDAALWAAASTAVFAAWAVWPRRRAAPCALCADDAPTPG